MTNSLFHYLIKIHSIPFIYIEDKPLWNRLCSFVLSSFFMQRKLEYCELLGLRNKLSYYKVENKKYAKKYADILRLYNAHIGELPEYRASQYELPELDDPVEDQKRLHDYFLNKSDDDFYKEHGQ